MTSVNPQLCLELPNGLVCYNGHLPGAIAVYICNKDYILHGDSTRECGQNGLWSGQVPQCLINSTSSPTILGMKYILYFAYMNCPQIQLLGVLRPHVVTSVHRVVWGAYTCNYSLPAPEPKSEDCEDVNLPISTIAAILIAASTVVCIVSCVIGALFHRTISSLSFSCRTGAKKGHTPPQHYYDEITLNTPAQSDPSTADPNSSTFHMTPDMEMYANRAYMHVNRVA